jgi:hypothetical protein
MRKFGLLLILVLNLTGMIMAGYILVEDIFNSKNEGLAPAMLEVNTAPEEFQAQTGDNEEEQVEAVVHENNFEDKGKAEMPASAEVSATAKIFISSYPDEAKIFVNGYFKGKTPSEVKILKVNTAAIYKISLIKEGNNRWEREIQLNPGEYRQFNVILQEDQK